MLKFFTYKTSYRFAPSFKEYYTEANLRQVAVLSLALFAINFFNRILGSIFNDNFRTLKNYTELDVMNWVQLGGSLFFLVTSRIALKSDKWSVTNKSKINIAFIVFILLVTYSISYIVSFHNTKNTLTLFLAGIVIVSLFFSVEFKHIFRISIFIVLVFILSIIFRDIAISEKLVNITGAFILGALLFCCSRYSYYYKSQHFVKLKELEAKNQEIELLNVQKSEILAFVAHDLRNPLNNIEGISEILVTENKDTDLVKLILKSTVHAKKIINDLIESEKTEQELLKEKINILDFLNDELEKWQINTVRKIILKNNDVDVMVNINVSKFERVLDNLISNGLKFSKKDTPIDIILDQNNDNVEITVKDYGIGIPNSLLPQLFNKFSKAGRTGFNGEKSTGLGLHISKKIVEQHGGKLSVYSKENEGTSFVISLPVY